jgi:hypothetical protein
MSEAIFGRDPACDVRVNDEYASPRHARVWQDDQGKLWVEDLGSTNGTWLGAWGSFRVHGPTPIGAYKTMWIGRTCIPITADADIRTARDAP